MKQSCAKTPLAGETKQKRTQSDAIFRYIPYMVYVKDVICDLDRAIGYKTDFIIKKVDGLDAYTYDSKIGFGATYHAWCIPLAEKSLITKL